MPLFPNRAYRVLLPPGKRQRTFAASKTIATPPREFADFRADGGWRQYDGNQDVPVVRSP